MNATPRGESRRCSILFLILGLRLAGAGVLQAEERFKHEILSVDATNLDSVAVHVAITKLNGDPLTDRQNVRVDIFDAEGGNRQFLHQESLSEGWELSYVLAMDLSSSMAGSKISQARLAAMAFVDAVAGDTEIAVIGFSGESEPILGFTTDKARLKENLRSLTTGGGTALQDAVDEALSQLETRSEFAADTGSGSEARNRRLALVLLTDGHENSSSGRYQGLEGRDELIKRAKEQGISVSMIGLGGDVDAVYLKKFEATGGHYLQSPSAEQLDATFREVEGLLKKQYLFRFPLNSVRADGLRERLDLEIYVDGERRTVKLDFLKPGVLPHVRGDHTYFVVIALVLLAFSPLRDLWAVFRFRSRFLRRLGPGSAQVGRRDLLSGDPLQTQDLVVLCPTAGCPHNPRSWRFLRCRCVDGHPGGSLCYTRRLPAWVRRGLDGVFQGRHSETGRVWLCRCAGDTDGY